MKSRELLRQSLKELRRVRLIVADAKHNCKNTYRQQCLMRAHTQVCSLEHSIKQSLR